MSKVPSVLCHLEDLPVGTTRGFDPLRAGVDTVFAIRDDAGVRVFRNICPHEGTPLGWRKDQFLTPDGSTIMCFAHAARFDRVTGVCFAGPCLGDRLELLPTEVDDLGRLLLVDTATVVASPRPAKSSPSRPKPDAVHSVVVSHIYQETPTIRALRIEPLRGEKLPKFTAGAHIDVFLPDNLKRSYSIASSPLATDHYLLGVGLTPDSNGGSRAVHGLARGDRLTISGPRNAFPLEARARRYVLVAAGIGITPLLSMAAQLHASEQTFVLHYCTRSRRDTAFINLIHQSSFCDKVVFHFSEDGPTGRLKPATILAGFAPRSHLYTCGPRPFMQAVLRTADELGWPADSLHYESF
ncbi:Rieske 2Fe-2S domain-containing protein [Asticcacaulis biprosthecium]|nr:Rieske 2Fe-2S domain-containing protein [Asticcacaulis biprosthecium]